MNLQRHYQIKMKLKLQIKKLNIHDRKLDLLSRENNKDPSESEYKFRLKVRHRKGLKQRLETLDIKKKIVLKPKNNRKKLVIYLVLMTYFDRCRLNKFSRKCNKIKGHNFNVPSSPLRTTEDLDTPENTGKSASQAPPKEAERTNIGRKLIEKGKANSTIKYESRKSCKHMLRAFCYKNNYMNIKKNLNISTFRSKALYGRLYRQSRKPKIYKLKHPRAKSNRRDRQFVENYRALRTKSLRETESALVQHGLKGPSSGGLGRSGGQVSSARCHRTTWQRCSLGGRIPL